MPVSAPVREHVAATSADPTADRVAKLKDLFPDVFADGKLDTAKLRAALGDVVAGDGERYTFGWAGRTDAAETLRMPTRATLLPVPEQSVNFDTTKNLYVEGDNLEVLKLLYKPYAGRVKLVYIDPPYNTGNDFIYPDDFRDTLANYLKLTGQTDEAGHRLTSNPDTSGRYHSDWLSMMYPRLFLARQLLCDDGVIFVSIDDHEVHHLRLLLNEVFGEENFVECFVWKRSYGGGAKEKYAVSQHEYLMMYCKSMDDLDEFWLPPDPQVEKKYYRYTDEKAATRGPFRLQPLEAGKSLDERPNLVYDITMPDGRKVRPKRQWLWGSERVASAVAANELVFTEKNGDFTVSYKQYLKGADGEKRGAKPASVIDGIYTQHGTQELNGIFDGDQLFQFPKPSKLIRHLIQFCTTADDLVLDFFSGSAPTAQAVLEMNREDGGNRRFILVQLPEPTENKTYPTIAEIGKERVRRVIAKLKADTANLTRTEPEDLGIKVFRLAESHLNQWSGVPERTPSALFEQMRLLADDPLRDGWTPTGLLWEVAIKEGYGLTSTIEPVPGVAATVYRVTDAEKGQQFLACLDDKLPVDITRQLGLTKDDLFVVRDLALDDTLASNLALQCRLKVI